MLRQDNAGQGAARNLAIDHAAGEYCAFLDSDDLLFPWSFSVLAQAIEENGRPPLIFGAEIRFQTLEAYEGAEPAPLKTLSWLDLFTFAGKHRLAGPGAVTAKTQILRDSGKFIVDRVVGEDVDLLYRLGTLSPMLQIQAPGTVGYRVHSEQFTVDPDKWYRGGCSLIRRCRDGIFPGGKAREAEVRKLICREMMMFIGICLFRGGRGIWHSLKLYISIFGWQLRAGHFGYLLKYPVWFALRLIGRWPIRARDRMKQIDPNSIQNQSLSVAS